jgi:hypothetical protein
MSSKNASAKPFLPIRKKKAKPFLLLVHACIICAKLKRVGEGVKLLLSAG